MASNGNAGRERTPRSSDMSDQYIEDEARASWLLSGALRHGFNNFLDRKGRRT
jgi:hypothetical protein